MSMGPITALQNPPVLLGASAHREVHYALSYPKPELLFPLLLEL